jgi:two-component system, sensor histidine kinase PdtaS
VEVDDDGVGLPAGFDLATATNLGLTIVGTLVESELNGRLELAPRPDGTGTRARIDVPL